MKRRLAMLLCAVMVLGTFTGCSSTTKTEQPQAENLQAQSAANTEELLASLINENGEITDRAAYSSIASESTSASITRSTGKKLENVSYVMIYNPFIYDENNDSTPAASASMNTGDMSSQIIVGMNKAGDLGLDIEIPIVRSQAENDANVDTSGVNRDGIRAGGMDPAYKVKDQMDFYHGDEKNISKRLLSRFQCLYSGDYCYIWDLNGSITSDQAKMMGTEFDTNIYEKALKAFGKARFTDEGGKINLLFYPMQDYGGFFAYADIFSSEEVPDDYAKKHGFNRDHAIIHVNSTYVTKDADFAKSTMAHELQHLICASDCFNFSETPWMDTWLNEAMSAYAEELTYPGIKEAGYYNQFMYLSNNYRTGQSLYNFDTKFDEYIGAYGAVYLFSQYLSQFSGSDVFSNVHSWWRNSYTANVKEATALAMSLSDKAFQTIMKKYSYPSKICEELLSRDNFDLTMSYLTLDFHVECLKPTLANLQGHEKQMHANMIYSEINPVDIEGGGRIIVATQNGTYKIPKDADPNLIYIGLDANFNPVSMVTYKK